MFTGEHEFEQAYNGTKMEYVEQVVSAVKPDDTKPNCGAPTAIITKKLLKKVYIHS